MMLTPGALLLLGTGQIRCTNAAPAIFVNGVTPIAANGLLSVVDAVPTVFCNGLGYSAAGSLCCATGGTAVASWQNGYPFTADGRVSTAAVLAGRPQNGLPITAGGFVSMAAPE